jgi:hypothetical protein
MAEEFGLSLYQTQIMLALGFEASGLLPQLGVLLLQFADLMPGVCSEQL